jgi:hypothetical protein
MLCVCLSVCAVLVLKWWFWRHFGCKYQSGLLVLFVSRMWNITHPSTDVRDLAGQYRVVGMSVGRRCATTSLCIGLLTDNERPLVLRARLSPHSIRSAHGAAHLAVHPGDWTIDAEAAPGSPTSLNGTSVNHLSTIRGCRERVADNVSRGCRQHQFALHAAVSPPIRRPLPSRYQRCPSSAVIFLIITRALSLAPRTHQASLSTAPSTSLTSLLVLMAS